MELPRHDARQVRDTGQPSETETRYRRVLDQNVRQNAADLATKAPINNPTFTGTPTFSKQSDPSEGGQFFLEKSSGSSLAGNVAFDLLTNTVRIFENGGSARGVNIDLTQCAASAGTSLLPQTTSWPLAVSAAASGASVTFSSIAVGRKVFLIAFDQVSHNSGSNQTFRVEISTNGGGSYSAAQDLSSSVSGGSNWTWAACIFAADQATKIITNMGNVGAVGSAVSLAGSITNLRFSPSGGSFDNGNIYVYAI